MVYPPACFKGERGPQFKFQIWTDTHTQGGGGDSHGGDDDDDDGEPFPSIWFQPPVTGS